MLTFMGPRRCGRTTYLVRQSMQTGFPIVVSNLTMKDTIQAMAADIYGYEEAKHNFPKPITIYEWLNYRKGLNGQITHVFIDDADIVLQRLFENVTIEAITVEDNGFNVIRCSPRRDDDG